MTHATDGRARNYTEFFCQHLVGLCWYEGPVNSNGEFTHQPAFHCASGFLLQVFDTCCLVTAGHVLSEYHERLQRNGHRGQQHSLFDIWSPRSTVEERIPFDFTEAPALVEYDKELGVDVAVVELPELYVNLLTQTIEPITYEHWSNQANVAFDFYAILGIPGQDAAQEFERSTTQRQSVTTYPAPRVVLVEACTTAQPDLENTPIPQFVGIIHPNEDIADIGGTSGGLILGFRREPDGRLRYWPVAVQSRWRDVSRTVIGTSLPAIAQGLHEWLAAREQEGAL